MDASRSSAGVTALMVLSGVTALVCASAIGTVAILVVMALDEPAPESAMTLAAIVHPNLNPQGDECVVVAWRSGMIYCFRDKPDEGMKPARYGPAVVVHAQADSAR